MVDTKFGIMDHSVGLNFIGGHVLVSTWPVVTFAHPLLKWIHGFIAEKSPPWSEEECKNFEHALQMYDKNFHLIQKHKVSVNLWFLLQVYANKNVYKVL